MAELRVEVKGVEVRGVVEKEGKVNKESGEKKPNFLVVKIEDEAAERHEFIDRDPENLKLYQRGSLYNMALVANYGNSFKGGWCRFEIKEAKKVK